MAARLRAFWRNLVLRKRVDRDLEEEVRGAYEQLVEDKIRAGLAPADAKRAATLEFGGTEGVKDRVRDARAGALFHSLGKDVSYALRDFAGILDLRPSRLARSRSVSGPTPRSSA